MSAVACYSISFGQLLLSLGPVHMSGLMQLLQLRVSMALMAIFTFPYSPRPTQTLSSSPSGSKCRLVRETNNESPRGNE